MARRGNMAGPAIAASALGVAAVLAGCAGGVQPSVPFDPATGRLFEPRIEEMPPEVARAACARSLTYLRTEIPPWEQARPWFVAWFTPAPTPDPEALRERAVCAESMDDQAVVFDPAPPPTSPLIVQDRVPRTFGNEGIPERGR